MPQKVVLINERTAAIVAQDVELATTSKERRQGLLGRDGLDASAAMMIAPCKAVHTWFMRFPIDVLFVDREGRAVKIVRDLKPWRMAAAYGAHAVVEFAAGSLQDISVGDRVVVTPRSASTAH